MSFKIKGIEGECEFSKVSMQDGLRIAGYASKMDSGGVDESAEAMVKLGDIALKYLIVDGNNVKDIAGLTLVCDDNPMILTVVTTKFMEEFQDFL